MRVVSKRDERMTRPHEPLLTAKELAAALRKSDKYVYAMAKKGFSMPGRTATLSEARNWLARNPPPFAGESRK